MNELTEYGDSMVEMAKLIATSSLIPSSLRGKPGDIVIIFMMAKELNIPRLQALNGINVIQGKPTISPQLMIALIKSRMPTSFIQIEQGPGWAKCTMCRDSKDQTQAYISLWDMERAERLMLTSKDNYKKQPETMLKWRAVGDCARTVFPDILAGFYFADEMNDGSIVTNDNGEIGKIPGLGAPKEPSLNEVLSHRFVELGRKTKCSVAQLLAYLEITVEDTKTASDSLKLEWLERLESYGR